MQFFCFTRVRVINFVLRQPELSQWNVRQSVDRSTLQSDARGKGRFMLNSEDLIELQRCRLLVRDAKQLLK
jgi:hypothetical protein